MDKALFVLRVKVQVGAMHSEKQPGPLCVYPILIFLHLLPFFVGIVATKAQVCTKVEAYNSTRSTASQNNTKGFGVERMPKPTQPSDTDAILAWPSNPLSMLHSVIVF